MDYFGILKKAYKINLRNRFLWIFGILAGGTAGFNGFNSKMPNSSQDAWKNMGFRNFSDMDWSSFWSAHSVAIITLLTLLFVVSVVFFVLNIISQAALIGAIDKNEDDQKINFANSFKFGWKKFWQVWGLDITLLLIMLIALSLWIIPVCLLVINGSYISAWVVGVLLFIVNFALWIMFAFISPYALRVVVLKKLSILQSIRQSLHFVRDNLAEVFVMYLLLVAINMVFGIALIIAMITLGGFLFLIGFGLFFISQFLLAIYILIAAIFFIAAIVVISGAYSSFHSTVLTLTYLKLSQKS